MCQAFKHKRIQAKTLELADILRVHGETYINNHNLCNQQYSELPVARV